MVHQDHGGIDTQSALSGYIIPATAHSLRADGFDASEDGTGRGTPLVPAIAPCLTGNYGKQPDNSDTSAGPMLIPIAFSAKDRGADATEDLSPTLRAGGHSKSHANAGVMPAVAFGFSAGQSEGAGTIAYRPEMSPTLRGASSGTNQVPALHSGMAVRRLTPRECERLQGFPDDWTKVGKAADGPRYKALGNAVTVNTVQWIAERIVRMDAK